MWYSVFAFKSCELAAEDPFWNPVVELTASLGLGGYMLVGIVYFA